MLLIREIMYCKPGKVRPMVEKFLQGPSAGSEEMKEFENIMKDYHPFVESGRREIYKLKG